MRYLFSTTLLIMLFCSGFTWGKTKEERCKEANELVFNQQVKNPDSLSTDLEYKVSDLCPGGTAEIFLSGLRHELNSQADRSMQEYEKVIKNDDNFPYAYGRIGLIQLSLNNKTGAIISLTKALESGGKNPRYHLALAGLLLETHDYPLALYHYKKSQALGISYNADSLAGIAKAYSGMENWKDAEGALRQALLLSPDDTKLKVELAHAVIRQQFLPEGIQILRQVIASQPDNKPLHRELADALYAAGDIKAAKSELKLASVPVADGAESLINQGDEFLIHCDFFAAIRCYKKALETKATPDILQKLGVAYLAVGNDDDALASYLKLLSISPDDARVHYSVAVIFERKGDINKAIAEYERCIVIDKNNEDARRRLAEIYALKGDLQKAIVEYQAILGSSPNNLSIQIELAHAYQRAEKYSEAAKSFESALLLAPKNLDVRRELVKLKIKMKDLSGAEKQCREILAAHRDDKQERKRLVGILVRQKKYHELEVFLTDESTRYPSDSTIFYQLGIVRDYLKEFRSAIQAFLKSISIKPTAQSYNALARSYLSISEPQKARDALVEAKKIDPNKKDVKELIEMIDEGIDHSNTGSGKGAGKKNH